jgi:hypothetical protein
MGRKSSSLARRAAPKMGSGQYDGMTGALVSGRRNQSSDSRSISNAGSGESNENEDSSAMRLLLSLWAFDRPPSREKTPCHKSPVTMPRTIGIVRSKPFGRLPASNGSTARCCIERQRTA